MTSDLLQSPILYINGHKLAAHRFSGARRSCSSATSRTAASSSPRRAAAAPSSTRASRSWSKSCGPTARSSYLAGRASGLDNAYVPVTPGEPYKLMGPRRRAARRCSSTRPQDLSCRWEKRTTRRTAAGDAGVPAGREHHRLRHRHGAAPAAAHPGRGRQQPDRPRTSRRAASSRSPSSSTPRRLAAGAAGDAQPDGARCSKHAGLDVVLKTKQTLSVGDKIGAQLQVPLHARPQASSASTRPTWSTCASTCEIGGLLFADACCGKEAFDKSFREFVERAVPEAQAGAGAAERRPVQQRS